MGLFDFLSRSSNDAPGSSCPRCGDSVPVYGSSAAFCDACNEMYDEEDGSSISVYSAAEIWASNGKDEDYMFGYSREELESAL